MLSIEMIPAASELPVSELTDTELDVVCGGLLNTTTFTATQNGQNIAVPVVIGNAMGGSAVANVAQGLNQAQFSAGFLQGSFVPGLLLT